MDSVCAADSEWTLDLRQGQTPSLVEGAPREGSPDLTLTISDDNFAKLVSGKLGQQQVHLLSAQGQSLPAVLCDLHNPQSPHDH